MKFNVIFLKKKYIYYTILAVILIILLIIFLGTRKSISTTFNTITNNKAIRADLTGDGNEDILYINTNKDKYYIQVNTKDKSYYLNPDKNINTVGTYSEYWPMKITLMDVNRDKLPEIFVQASEKNVSIQHIFKWNGDSFKDVNFSKNNLLGFLDCQNNKTPKILSGNITSDAINLSYYVLVKDKLQKYEYTSKDNYYGKDSVLAFIKYIQGLPGSEGYKPNNIFYPGLTGNALDAIGKLASENNTYKFEDAVFMDSKWDKDGNISEIKWTLDFKGISNKDNKQIKPCTINLTLKACSDMKNSNSYKIQSIALSH